MGGFSAEMARVLGRLRGTDAYIMGDFNIDLLKASNHGPTSTTWGSLPQLDFILWCPSLQD